MSQERLLKVLLKPHISEKASRSAEQVAFRVVLDATKTEIKAAVETLFNVKVTHVRTCHVEGKKRTFKQKAGQRKSWKKAYVALSEGHQIDFASSGQ